MNIRGDATMHLNAHNKRKVRQINKINENLKQRLDN